MEATIPENKFVSLSYESYLTDAINGFKEIKSTENLIMTENLTFEKEISVLKSQYATLSNEANQNEIKVTFGDKIIKWFTKIWVFLCEIFSKIYEIVIALIKSLIIFVQKKKLQAHNIIKMIEEKGLTGFNTEHKDIINQMIKSNIKLNMLDIKSIEFNDRKHNKSLAPYQYISTCLNNPQLQDFVNSSIILKNPNSIFSTDSLNKYLSKDILNESTDEDNKINVLDEFVDKMYGEAIISNEVDPKHCKPSPLLTKYAGLISTRNISGLSHNIVMGVDKPSFISMNLAEFFGFQNDYNLNVEELRFAFRQYYEDSQLVLGDKGYINTIQEILKRYKDQAKKDNDNIKQMQKTILNYLNTIGTRDGEGERIKHRCSRFTNIVMKVKSIKSHFIRLRQSVILDIITIFSIENKAWYELTGNGGLLKDSDGFKELADMKNDPIINTKPQDPMIMVDDE